MELGRGPRFDKDADDLASCLGSGVVKVGLFVLVAIVAVSLLIGVFS